MGTVATDNPAQQIQQIQQMQHVQHPAAQIPDKQGRPPLPMYGRHTHLRPGLGVSEPTVSDTPPARAAITATRRTKTPYQNP